MSFSTAKAPPAGSATLATCDSSTSSVEVLRAIRRANASGSPSRASNGSTVTASAPPTPAAKAATQVRSMFTHGSYLVIIGREVTACSVMVRWSGEAPLSSSIRAHSRRTARSLAMVTNWSSLAESRNSTSPAASSTAVPDPASARR